MMVSCFLGFTFAIWTCILSKVICLSLFFFPGEMVLCTNLGFCSGDAVVAICPNNNEVHIYKVSASPDTAWERVYVLEKVICRSPLPVCQACER
jgi:hypothetical protein